MLQCSENLKERRAVWRRPTQHCEAILLQLKINLALEKKIGIPNKLVSVKKKKKGKSRYRESLKLKWLYVKEPFVMSSLTYFSVETKL